MSDMLQKCIQCGSPLCAPYYFKTKTGYLCKYCFFDKGMMEKGELVNMIVWEESE